MDWGISEGEMVGRKWLAQAGGGRAAGLRGAGLPGPGPGPGQGGDRPDPMRDGGAGLVVCALAGLAMGLAMPPWGLWGLAWVALWPLWHWGIQRGSWRGVLVWGGLYQGLTLHWLWALHPLTWMGLSWGASWVIALACWLGVIVWRLGALLLWTRLVFWLTVGSSQGGAAGGRAGRSRPASPGLRVLVGTALWCAIDSLWGWGPLYWDSFALSQSPHNLAVLHLGQLAGPMAINGAIVAVNGLLAEAWGMAAGRGLARGDGWSLQRLLALALVLFLALHGGGGLLYLGAAQASGSSGAAGAGTSSQASSQASSGAAGLTIGLIQGNIPTREKLTAAGVNQALQHYARGLEQLAEQGADAVLLPEGALPFLWSEQRNSLGKPFLAAIARHPDTTVWLGAFERGSGLEPAPDDQSSASRDRGIRQSLLNLDAQGLVTSRYNKVKLVPLGEYLPGEALLRPVLRRLSSLPEGMVPGRSPQTFQTPWGPAAVMICYEPAFSHIARRQVRAGGQWLLTLANLDPYGEVLMAQSEALDVMRAVESDRWLVRATNTGYSGVIEPSGRVRWRSPARQFVTHGTTIFPRQTQTPYVRWGNWLTPLLLVLAGLALLGEGAAWKR